MEKPIDSYFLNHDLDISNCLQFLRTYIPKINLLLVEEWKYGMPFFSYKGKNILYLWVHKKLKQPYIGFVDGDLLNHPKLIIEKRKKMKILLVNHIKDLEIDEIFEIVSRAIKVRN